MVITPVGYPFRTREGKKFSDLGMGVAFDNPFAIPRRKDSAPLSLEEISVSTVFSVLTEKYILIMTIFK